MEFNSIQDFRSNFAHIYHTSVIPKLDQFEKVKNNAKFLCFVVWTITILIVAAAVYINLQSTQDSEILAQNILMTLVMAYFIQAIITSYICKKFEKRMKKQIMPAIMKAFGNFLWTTAGTIPSYIIKASELYTRFDEKKDDDSFFGTYKDLEININETRLTYTTRDSKGRRHTHVEFSGVLVQIDVKKPFKGHTIIRKRGLLNNRTYEEIKLEDPEFSKLYFVDGSDQVESRYVLTTSFMERFKNIKNAFRASQMEASLKDNKILIAISTNKDLFSLGNVFKPLNDTKQFTLLLDEFVSILAIVDELKLNQNIGL